MGKPHRSQKEIEEAFKFLGLESEEERQKFKDVENLNNKNFDEEEKSPSEHLTSHNTSEIYTDAKLERDSE